MVSGAMTSEEPWTVRRILDWTNAYLQERGSETPRLDAEVLLAHARKCRRIELYTRYDEVLTEDQRAQMRSLVKRRGAAEPVAYLVGHREFFSLDFEVQPGVFIPRPDTEVLVMAALEILRPLSQPRVLELCTGSACIPVALAKNNARLRCTTVEIDPRVAEVARRNLAKHHVEDRVELLAGDLFEPVSAERPFDIVLSNPPYIPSAEILELDADVQAHEPHLALDGGADGLDVIRRLVEGAPGFLSDDGWLMFELSPEQTDSASHLLHEHSYREIAVKSDLSGQGRVVMGRRPPRDSSD